MNIIEGIIKILEVIGRLSEVHEELKNNSQQRNIIEILLRFLRSHISSDLNGHAFRCLAQLISQPDTSLADRLWTRLEDEQTLFTWRQNNEPIDKGIELDFLEKYQTEERTRCPATVGFCYLLSALLRTTKLPHELGLARRGQKPPGIHLHMEYVSKLLLRNWPKRNFDDFHEKWELAGLCLEIFEIVLEKENPLEFRPMPSTINNFGYFIFIIFF
ncbi:hypothetical protein RFI_21179 [Reticulomyxa filosa]|uniref:Uncharacterized protein n=1 Tax=Reticulomyxa filosa TaxID=46433 RepID=X6MQN5_RETFI|nr:hypothetical protein RFI_21179 [Reticulomyxa filosa]|eukprot:ETO16179.1 hypothetical protein RFI_21179 [Reticulomyxa filosa]